MKTGTEITSLAQAQALDGPGRADTFIGKRTAKGLVIRQLHRGEAIAQWFVPVGRGDKITGEPLRIPFERGARFEPCMTPGEAEKVLFFARRGLGGELAGDQ
jgi:hypothetical protein